jgi:hypothetical protein
MRDTHPRGVGDWGHRPCHFTARPRPGPTHAAYVYCKLCERVSRLVSGFGLIRPDLCQTAFSDTQPDATIPQNRHCTWVVGLALGAKSHASCPRPPRRHARSHPRAARVALPRAAPTRSTTLALPASWQAQLPRERRARKGGAARGQQLLSTGRHGRTRPRSTWAAMLERPLRCPRRLGQWCSRFGLKPRAVAREPNVTFVQSGRRQERSEAAPSSRICSALTR